MKVKAAVARAKSAPLTIETLDWRSRGQEKFWSASSPRAFATPTWQCAIRVVVAKLRRLLVVTAARRVEPGHLPGEPAVALL